MSLDTSPSPASAARPATARRAGRSDGELDRRRPLPAWPLAWLLVATPLWWLLGTIDFVIVPIAVVMVYYLRRSTHVRVPRGFAIWLIFLLFMLASGIEITKFNSYFTFAYRAGIYLGSTVVFVYVYNSRRWIPDRKVLQYLVWYLVTMTVGGFLGAVKPIGQFRTPTYYVLAKVSPFLVSNDLVKVMVVRPFSQYDPTNYFQIPPRPTAPFIFTNNWGNAYSMVLPLVLIYFLESPKRSWQRRLSGLLLPVSAVPAMLTLNRGMFIGLGIVAVYVGLRLAARGYLGRVVLSAAVAGGIGLVLWKALNVSAGLHTRVEASTDTRASLYDQALHSVQSSPLFGYGVTIQSTSTNPWDPKVGTQGQFWMVLISHGVIATACFVGFFLVAVVLTFRRRDFAGMVCNAVVLAGVIETIYYGLVPYGLPLLMIAAALAWRPAPVARSRLSEAEPGVPRP